MSLNILLSDRIEAQQSIALLIFLRLLHPLFTGSVPNVSARYPDMTDCQCIGLIGVSLSILQQRFEPFSPSQDKNLR